MIRPLLPRYGLAPDAPLSRLCHSENETWAAGDVVFRLHREGYHAAGEIAAELAWLAALRDHPGVASVRPVPDRAGRVLQHSGGRHVVAFRRLAGRVLAADEDLGRWFPELGAVAARLHAHARRWSRPAGFRRKRWDAAALFGPAAIWGDWGAAPGLDAAGRAVLARLVDDLDRRLAAWGGGDDRFGLIHADLRLANLMTDGAGLTVIDFDDCGFGWWLFDFAAAVSFIEDDPRLPALADGWARGYRRVAPLGAAEVAMLPVMVLARRLQLTAWLASRAGNDTAAALGGAGFTARTVALAEGYLARGPARIWS
ncbi:hypothetical protein CCR87_04895 [Rhodobaculum claviforme]|uniref:Aminoglycoside phosphotransferase domain-containing protein n=1 Tax=Rhodobaculum claviforme TaxID=1549854 RepID=A0A934TIB1_9RHOB|nr:phosphotransferase [Rhodobaculum claviforme]MBK5926689.1 hypothetical protein [Rhodobaculum claviforme]